MVPLIVLTEEHSWPLEVVGSREVIEDSSVESSSPSVRVAGSEYVIYENFGPSGTNSLFFEFDISLWGWRGQNFFKDVIRQSFREELEHCATVGIVPSNTCKVFESGDVIIDFWKLHGASFYFASGPILLLAILILLGELEEKLIPNIWNVIKYRVESVQPGSHVACPTSDLWSFHEGEGQSDFLDWGVVTGYILVELKISFYFFNKVISKEAVSGEDLW